MPKNFICRDWTDSRRIDSLDAHAERFFLRLLMKVDYLGRILEDTELLNSHLFPLKKNIRNSDITRWLDACCVTHPPLIRRYVDSKGRPILQVENFGQRLQHMRSDYDPPDGQQNFSLPNREVNRREVKAPAPREEKTEQRLTTRPSCQANGKRQLWQLLADEQTLTTRIRHECESQKPDRELITALKTERTKIREQLKQ